MYLTNTLRHAKVRYKPHNAFSCALRVAGTRKVDPDTMTNQRLLGKPMQNAGAFGDGQMFGWLVAKIR